LDEGKVEELELLREQVQTHQGVIENHEARLKELETGHSVLRDEQDDFHSKIELIEKNQLELKNVIYSENRETRETMRGTTDKLFMLIEQMTGQKQASTALEYDYKKASLEIKDKKSQRFWEWFGKAAGAGGVIALVVAALLQLLGQ
jgi:DNA mismatch repair ATPase MutS